MRGVKKWRGTNRASVQAKEGKYSEGKGATKSAKTGKEGPNRMTRSPLLVHEAWKQKLREDRLLAI